MQPEGSQSQAEARTVMRWFKNDQEEDCLSIQAPFRRCHLESTVQTREDSRRTAIVRREIQEDIWVGHSKFPPLRYRLPFVPLRDLASFDTWDRWKTIIAVMFAGFAVAFNFDRIDPKIYSPLPTLVLSFRLLSLFVHETIELYLLRSRDVSPLFNKMAILLARTQGQR